MPLSLVPLSKTRDASTYAGIPIIKVRCHYCSHFVHPKEIRQLGVAALMCYRCYAEKHTPAVYGFRAPSHCRECKTSFQDLRARATGPYVSMYLHWKDGIYQALCWWCDRKYVEKRKDLYGPTPFGKERGL